MWLWIACSEPDPGAVKDPAWSLAVPGGETETAEPTGAEDTGRAPDSEPAPHSGSPADTADTACRELPFYADADGDGYGDAGAQVAACSCPEGHVDNRDDCNDHSALAYPGGEPACDGVDNDCDGVVEDCRRWVGDHDATEADASLTGVAGNWLGVCDLDADGAADIVTGQADDSGTAYVFSIPSSGTTVDATDVLATVEGATSGEGLAGQGACLRDLTGDGLDELALDRESGAVILAGPLGGATTSGAAVTVLDSGHAFAALDHDGDGDHELAVGAYDDDTTGNQEGAVRLFDGLASSLGDGDAAATRYGTTRAYLGATITNLGDIDGDGNEDLAAGATGVSTSGTDGAVWAWLGPLRDVLEGESSADLRVSSTAAGGLGAAIDGAGDVDGDGTADLVVAGDRQVLAFAGPVPLGDLDETDAIGVLDGFDLQGVATADSDGDGASDLWVGQPSGSRVSVAYLFYGPVAGALAAADASFVSYGYYDHFGTAVASLGDVDGSGTDEVAVANPARSGSADVYLFYGGAL